MKNYNIDLDYVLPKIDISKDELKEIIAEADRIISENKECTENLAVAYLKKAQCLLKLEELGCFFDSSKEKTQNQAKETIEKALELSPDMAEAIMQMGKLFGSMSKPEDAISMYSRAIEIKPDYAAALNNRSNVYFDCWEKNNCQDNLQKAMTDLTEAIRLRPFDATYYHNRGRDYAKLKEYEKAIADFSYAIQYGSDEFKTETKIHQQRGLMYMEMENYGKAFADFTESAMQKTNLKNSLSLYDIDLDYVFMGIDISENELMEIVTEAERIINDNKENSENMAKAYLKMAKCFKMISRGHFRVDGDQIINFQDLLIQLHCFFSGA
jgi:tetratricopeptide (TPR) repeat protein